MQFQENPPERWKAGQKVRQALFNSILPATAGGQKIELFTRLPENCSNAVDEFFEWNYFRFLEDNKKNILM